MLVVKKVKITNINEVDETNSENIIEGVKFDSMKKEISMKINKYHWTQKNKNIRSSETEKISINLLDNPIIEIQLHMKKLG